MFRAPRKYSLTQPPNVNFVTIAQTNRLNRGTTYERILSLLRQRRGPSRARRLFFESLSRSILCLRMICAQTRSAFVAGENRCPPLPDHAVAKAKIAAGPFSAAGFYGRTSHLEQFGVTRLDLLALC